MTAIVAVHGVGNHAPHRSPEEVVRSRSGEWATALAKGMRIDPDNLDLMYSYWAAVLHEGVPVAQGVGADPDLVLDQIEHTDPGATELVAAWLAALDVPQATAHGRLAMPLRHAAQLVAQRLSLDGRLTRVFVAVFFPEVARYLAQETVRIAVRDQVARTIRDRDARVVLAHSLGTIVAYEALHAHPDLEVDLLVTLGSPLALPDAVFPRLDPTPVRNRGTRPPGVSRWVNVADYGDPVAILRPLTRYFSDVDLDLEESVGLFEFHRAHRYLSSASVAATVQPYLHSG